MKATRLGISLLLVLGGVVIGLVVGEVLRVPPPPSPSPDAQAPREDRERRGEALAPAVAEYAAGSSLAGRGTAAERQADAWPPVAPVSAGEGVAVQPVPRAGAMPNMPAELGVLDVIRRLRAADTRQPDARLVGAAFVDRFHPTAEGPTIRADEIEPTAALEDGTVVVLDEGVHDFSSFSGAHRGRFPADLTFRGIGRNRTLLILHEVSATGAMRNLAFEDLTLDTRGHYLADVRGDEPISLRFLRARVIGFDAAPGGAVLLAARHGAVLAQGTEFLAGFGGAPGTGSFFHVRGPFLVRFEDCLVRGAFKSLYERSDRAAYLYTRCRFEQMHPDRRRDLETGDPSVVIQDCAIDYARAGDPLPARSLGELNEDWRRR